MLIELSQSIGTYLHEVFVLRLDVWTAVGFAAQILFSMRFIVQWVASERAGRSIVPLAFWLFSIGGGVLLLVYAVQRGDPVFIVGQASGLAIYVRNIWLVMRERRATRMPA